MLHAAHRRRGGLAFGHALAEDRAAVGARDRAALRPLCGLRGAWLFWIVPFIDRVSSVISQRRLPPVSPPEQTLTPTRFPVNVDAVLFWMVHDGRRRRR